jgi:hypothetical protein
MKIYETIQSISEAVMSYEGGKWCTLITNTNSVFHTFFQHKKDLQDFYSMLCWVQNGVRFLKISDSYDD